MEFSVNGRSEVGNIRICSLATVVEDIKLQVFNVGRCCAREVDTWDSIPFELLELQRP